MIAVSSKTLFSIAMSNLVHTSLDRSTFFRVWKNQNPPSSMFANRTPNARFISATQMKSLKTSLSNLSTYLIFSVSIACLNTLNIEFSISDWTRNCLSDCNSSWRTSPLLDFFFMAWWTPWCSSFSQVFSLSFVLKQWVDNRRFPATFLTVVRNSVKRYSEVSDDKTFKSAR